MVLPERLTLEASALSVELDGPAGRLLLEEPQPELLGTLLDDDEEDRPLPQPEELLLPQLLPEELREEPPHPPPEELNEERPPEKPPPLPPRANPSLEGHTRASERRNAARSRKLSLDERDIR